jgi:hypothetical protein
MHPAQAQRKLAKSDRNQEIMREAASCSASFDAQPRAPCWPLGHSYLDSVPFLAVTGNVPTSQFNRGAFQELYRHYQADFPATVRAYCKRVFQPTRGDMVPLAIRQAWKTMVTGRPGPVVLDVPFDIFKEAAAEETPKPQDWNAAISCRCGADPDGVKQAVDMLLTAERPVILIGQGVKYGGAAADLRRLAEQLRIPVAWSASGTGAIDAHHPLALGLVARNGPYQANHAARTADVLLALGVRFDDRTSSSWLPGYSFTIPPTKLIHVDIDPDEIARNYPVALGLMADVRTFLRQLLAELDARRNVSDAVASRAGWLDKIESYRKQWNAFVAPGRTHDSTPIHPQRAAHEIDKALPDDAILVSDIGVHHNWRAGLQSKTTGFPSARWASVRWDSESPVSSAHHLPHPTGHASPSAVTAPSSCTRACSAPRWNTIFRSSGWCGTISPTPRSAACNAAISAAASLRQIFVIPRPAHPTIPILPPWRARPGSTASTSIVPAIFPTRWALRSPRAAPISSMPTSVPTRTLAARGSGSCREWARASPPSAEDTSRQVSRHIDRIFSTTTSLVAALII